jgi:hypothetical protein
MFSHPTIEPHGTLSGRERVPLPQMRKLRLGQKIASKLQEHFKAETITKTLHSAQGWSFNVAKPNLPNILFDW